MKKILNIDRAVKISKNLRSAGKTIVLAGGCFDILHIGHIKFLQKAKEQADFLFVFLESDEAIQRIKGKKRPLNIQKDRAEILSALSFVDYVIILPLFKTNKEYDNLVIKIKPDIIATTEADLQKIHKERQVKLINAKIVNVLKNISNQSTSRIVKLLDEL